MGCPLLISQPTFLYRYWAIFQNFITLPFVFSALHAKHFEAYLATDCEIQVINLTFLHSTVWVIISFKTFSMIGFSSDLLVMAPVSGQRLVHRLCEGRHSILSSFWRCLTLRNVAKTIPQQKQQIKITHWHFCLLHFTKNKLYKSRLRKQLQKSEEDKGRGRGDNLGTMKINLKQERRNIVPVRTDHRSSRSKRH